MLEAEIANYLKSIEKRDERIETLISTIKKALQMMKYPRLMQLILREIEFDRFEFTWEEKIAAVKEKIDLTAKEEQEVRDVGVVLCPNTLKEFYEHLRAVERKVESEQEAQNIEEIRRRNIKLEGTRLKLDKETKKGVIYPRDSLTAKHLEDLNRLRMDITKKHIGNKIYDQTSYPIIGGPTAQI